MAQTAFFKAILKFCTTNKIFVIRYLQKKALSPKEIHAGMVATLGDDAPALSTLKKWAAKFKRVGKTLKMTQDQDVL